MPFSRLTAKKILCFCSCLILASAVLLSGLTLYHKSRLYLPASSQALKNLAGLELYFSLAGQLEKTTLADLPIKLAKQKIAGLAQAKILLTTPPNKLGVSFTEPEFSKFLQNLFPAFSRPARDAQIIYNKDSQSFTIIPSQAGQAVNETAAQPAILASLNSLALSSQLPRNLVKLELKPVAPDFTTRQAQILTNQLSQLWPSQPNQYLVLQAQDQQAKISLQPIIDWLTPNPAAGQAKITAYLSQLSDKISRPAQNAHWRLNNDNQIELIAPAQPGWQIDIPESQKIINTELALLFLKPAASPDWWQIDLASKILAAQITENSLFNHQITTLLSQGQSDFAGSPANRVHNITTGADKLNGWLIAPNDVFSFNQAIGSVNALTGFLPELVIKDKAIIPEYGGGLCQVSTTLFRAALKAGLTIKERFSHTYYVPYNYPPGSDATVYQPHPDLIFKNNTNNWLLLKTNITGTKLIIEIYGTSDGRQVKILGPYIISQSPDKAMSAVLTQELYYFDKLFARQQFWSHYAAKPEPVVEPNNEDNQDAEQ